MMIDNKYAGFTDLIEMDSFPSRKVNRQRDYFLEFSKFLKVPTTIYVCQLLIRMQGDDNIVVVDQGVATFNGPVTDFPDEYLDKEIIKVYSENGATIIEVSSETTEEC